MALPVCAGGSPHGPFTHGLTLPGGFQVKKLRPREADVLARDHPACEASACF